MRNAQITVPATVAENVCTCPDTIPWKLTVPAKAGPRAGKAPVPIDTYLDEYYALRGWDSLGRPTARRLERLGVAGYRGHAGI